MECLGPPHPEPDAESVARIEQHFGIELPLQLIELATHSKSFSSRFLGLGPDFSSVTHIVRVNSYWRRRRVTRQVPREFVIMTMGFMDQMFWCLDKSSLTDTDRLPVQFWCPEEILYASENDRPTERYPDFGSFIEADICWSEYHSKHKA